MPRMMTHEEYIGINYQAYKQMFEEAVAQGHFTWVDNDTTPIHAALKPLYEEVKHRKPGLRLKLSPITGQLCVTRLSFVYEDAPDIECGSVWRHDNKYHIRSDSIKNNRFRAGSKEYYSQSTENLAKAIKIAKTHINPRVFSQVRAAHGHAASSALYEIQRNAHDKLREHLDFDWNTVMREVENMVVRGYEPVTTEFRTAINFFQQEGAERKRLNNYAPMKCFVWLKPDKAVYQIDNGEEVQANTLDEIPEEIRNKLSVLNLAEPDKPLADVGVRVDNTKFWVFL